MNDIFQDREKYCDARIAQLREQIGQKSSCTNIDSLAIYATGSFARGDAWHNSDIDLFFVIDGDLQSYPKTKIKTLRMFSSIIEITDKMGFPELTNDGQFLEVFFIHDILSNLGGQVDDYLNHFTARMLMLLESTSVCNGKSFDAIRDKIIDSYFRDYPDHPGSFQPTFLTNDIIRFWKTLCLNYEHKRNQPADDTSVKVKQKIKNFKLKYSRMLTCFSAIAYLSAIKEPVSPEHVQHMARLTPRQRMREVPKRVAQAEHAVEAMMDEYRWFLGMTGCTEDQLRTKFENKENLQEYFGRADRFGELVYNVLEKIDAENGRMRYLLV